MDFTPVMCPPSLTELCRYLFIKEIVRFPAGSGRLLFTAAEQQPENGTAQRAAVQHLPAQRHGEGSVGHAARVQRHILVQLMYPSFLDFWCKNTPHLLYTLRIDNSAFVVYNKARNQRSTAEAQMRANPADLKQKGARPMVDMEPAQQGQAVGVR